MNTNTQFEMDSFLKHKTAERKAEMYRVNLKYLFIFCYKFCEIMFLMLTFVDKNIWNNKNNCFSCLFSSTYIFVVSFCWFRTDDTDQFALRRKKKSSISV